VSSSELRGSWRRFPGSVLGGAPTPRFFHAVAAPTAPGADAVVFGGFDGIRARGDTFFLRIEDLVLALDSAPAAEDGTAKRGATVRAAIFFFLFCLCDIIVARVKFLRSKHELKLRQLTLPPPCTPLIPPLRTQSPGSAVAGRRRQRFQPDPGSLSHPDALAELRAQREEIASLEDRLAERTGVAVASDARLHARAAAVAHLTGEVAALGVALAAERQRAGEARAQASRVALEARDVRDDAARLREAMAQAEADAARWRRECERVTEGARGLVREARSEARRAREGERAAVACCSFFFFFF
jgi:hypothetical protein